MPYASALLPWLDFHTHQPYHPSQGYVSVRSYSPPLLQSSISQEYFTAGLHPWETALPENRQWIETELVPCLKQANCLGLGEVGLDRGRGAALPEQQALLELQLDIAKRLQLPIVVHCVRAWSELMASFKRVKPTTAKAIHGYNGSYHVLQSLLAEDWYISPQIRRNGTMEQLVSNIPVNRLLLETDATTLTGFAVAEVAAAHLNASVEAVTRQVDVNTRRFYSIT